MPRGRPVVNKFKVPARQWKAWSNDARRVFNHMHHAMRPSRQFVFIHPKAKALPLGQWATTRWNTAWEAACAVDRTSHAAKVGR